MVLKKITHIIPVGHTKEKFLEILNQFPVQKVILLVGKDINASGEKQVFETAKKLGNFLKDFVEIEQLSVDKLHVLSGAIEILEIIKNEKEKGYEVKINITGSLHTVGISCYIAALVSKTEIYSALPEYDRKKVTGIERIINIPFFPIKNIPSEQMDILTALKTLSVNSIEELIIRIKPGLEKDSKEYHNERGRLNHHLKALRKEEFLIFKKVGKNVKISISDIGRIYLMGKEISG